MVKDMSNQTKIWQSIMWGHMQFTGGWICIEILLCQSVDGQKVNEEQIIQELELNDAVTQVGFEVIRQVCLRPFNFMCGFV